jgi:probable selenium-dependent hydroxylase accessory protein YqeC
MEYTLDNLKVMNIKNLIKKFNIPKTRIISVIGSGGKTTLIYMLAKELRKNGYKIAITTTTHMMIPDIKVFNFIDSIMLDKTSDEIEEESNKHFVSLIGNKSLHGKLSSPSEDTLKTILSLYDIVLIEADGSKKKPIKVPRDYEPVIIEKTQLVVGVIGLSGMYKKISEVSQSANLVAEILHKDKNDIITPKDIANLISNPKGIFKNFAGFYDTIALLNQTDTVTDTNDIKKILNYLKTDGITAYPTTLI